MIFGRAILDWTLVDERSIMRSRIIGEDNHEFCCYWAANGQCFLNPAFMRRSCQKSCGTAGCSPESFENCKEVKLNIESCPFDLTSRQRFTEAEIARRFRSLDINSIERLIKTEKRRGRLVKKGIVKDITNCTEERICWAEYSACRRQQINSLQRLQSQKNDHCFTMFAQKEITEKNLEQGQSVYLSQCLSDTPRQHCLGDEGSIIDEKLFFPFDIECPYPPRKAVDCYVMEKCSNSDICYKCMMRDSPLEETQEEMNLLQSELTSKCSDYLFFLPEL